MWIFDKLFNRKIEGKSSLDDLAENVVVNKETNTTENEVKEENEEKID